MGTTFQNPWHVPVGDSGRPSYLRAAGIWKCVSSSAILRRSKVDCQTAAALARARKLRAVFGELAGLTAWSAAKELNRRKVQTPAGGRWHANSIERVRARLAGKYGHHPITPVRRRRSFQFGVASAPNAGTTSG